MKQYIIYAAALSLLASCKLQPDSDRNYDAYNPDKVYKLGLRPAAGSAYQYDITNESEMELEVNGKEIDNISRTNSVITYDISLDSNGNYLFKTIYEKVKLYTKSGDQETNADADNGYISINPVERMLGLLKKANIVAIISPSGEVKDINGYTELGEQMMAAFDANDTYSKNIAQEKWDQLIGEGIIKKNMDQLFKIFPDSAVHLNDTWNMKSKQEGEIDMNVTGKFKLKAINEEIAIISSEGTINGDNNQQPSTILGQGNVTTDLNGTHEGEFEIERKTGMLMSGRIKSKITGTISMAGRVVPVEVINSTEIKGTRKK